MGQICGCLKNAQRIPVQAYQTEEQEDRCVCGHLFPSADANFCCSCGEPREGGRRPQRKYSIHSNTSRQSSASGSKFANIMPGTVPSASRRNRRSGTAGSTPSVSSKTTADEASEEQRSDEKHHSHLDRKASRCNSRHSASSRSTNDSISVASDKTSESSSPKRTRNPLSGIVHCASTDIPRKKKVLDSSSQKKTPESPRGTKSPKDLRVPSTEAGHDDMVSALSKALTHSGSLLTTSVQMRALQVPDGLSAASNFRPKLDTQMPPFEAKVDQDNLLKMIPQGPLKSHQLSLQKVTFMSTDWLGLRLANGSHSQCISFCLMVTALQNIGKSTSRSVVVETSDEEAIQLGFACAPTFSNKKSKCSTSFIDHAEDISELAQIFSNEDGNIPKKLTANLKKWCEKNQRRLLGNDSVTDDSQRSKSLFSLRGLFASIEESLGALSCEANGSKLQGGRRNSNASTSSERRMSLKDRRRSLPLGLEISSSRVSASENSSPKPRSTDSVRGGSKSKRSYDATQSQPIDSSLRHLSPELPERRRRNSDPGLTSMMGLSEQETITALKMKRKKSLDATIMPTLNEEDSDLKEVASVSPHAIERP